MWTREGASGGEKVTTESVRNFIAGDSISQQNRKKIEGGRKEGAGWDEGEKSGFPPKVVLALGA